MALQPFIKKPIVVVENPSISSVCKGGYAAFVHALQQQGTTLTTYHASNPAHRQIDGKPHVLYREWEKIIGHIMVMERPNHFVFPLPPITSNPMLRDQIPQAIRKNFFYGLYSKNEYSGEQAIAAAQAYRMSGMFLYSTDSAGTQFELFIGREKDVSFAPKGTKVTRYDLSPDLTARLLR